MAARGSFQKRKKEAERREKRQVKLDRRQGRQPVGSAPNGTTTDDENALNAENDTVSGGPATPATEDTASHLGPSAEEAR